MGAMEFKKITVVITFARTTRLLVKWAMFQQLFAMRFELQHETVFVAQPADVEIIFECLVVVFQSHSLCDFHWEVVMDTKGPYSVFVRFPVMFVRTVGGVALVFSDGPRPACRSFKKLISLRFQLFPVL